MVVPRSRRGNVVDWPSGDDVCNHQCPTLHDNMRACEFFETTPSFSPSALTLDVWPFENALERSDEHAYVWVHVSGHVEFMVQKTATRHIPATEVISPKNHWSLIAVLDDAGAGDIAVALGKWDQKPVLAMRWNGDDENNALGNPQSRGLPTWFILPTGDYSEAIIRLLPADKQTLVRNFIPKSGRT
jgi:hypothetical protein